MNAAEHTTDRKFYTLACRNPDGHVDAALTCTMTSNNNRYHVLAERLRRGEANPTIAEISWDGTYVYFLAEAA